MCALLAENGLRTPLLEAYELYDPGRDRWGLPLATGNEHDLYNGILAREWLTYYCAWAVPTTRAIQAIADLDMPVVEIGAGTGYWAWLLQQVGVSVVAFDKYLEGHYQDTGDPCQTNDDHWVEVQEGTHTVLYDAYQDHALMLCWPPYANEMASDCLRAYEGDTLIYIGEGHGGCTGNDDFHLDLDMGWTRVAGVALPKWPGLHDDMNIYRRGRAEGPKPNPEAED